MNERIREILDRIIIMEPERDDADALERELYGLIDHVETVALKALMEAEAANKSLRPERAEQYRRARRMLLPDTMNPITKFMKRNKEQAQQDLNANRNFVSNEAIIRFIRAFEEETGIKIE